jgi:hypothetical protein
MSLGEAARNVASGMADAFAKQASQNIATMAEEAVTGKGIRSQEIRDDAGAAAAGAYKAIAAIPYVGPFLAPAAAAVAYSAVLAFDSAEGGWDIPAGVNPSGVQLHEREMVLPAPLAEGIRNMVGQQNSANNAPRGGGGGVTTVHLHAKSRNDTITVDQVAGLIKQAGLQFKLSGL